MLLKPLAGRFAVCAKLAAGTPPKKLALLAVSLAVSDTVLLIWVNGIVVLCYSVFKSTADQVSAPTSSVSTCETGAPCVCAK